MDASWDAPLDSPRDAPWDAPIDSTWDVPLDSPRDAPLDVFVHLTFCDKSCLRDHSLYGCIHHIIYPRRKTFKHRKPLINLPGFNILAGL